MSELLSMLICCALLATLGCSGTRTSPAIAAGRSTLTAAGTPVTVKITKIAANPAHPLDTGARGAADWYVGVTIDGKLHDTHDLRIPDHDVVPEHEGNPLWSFTDEVGRVSGTIRVGIEVWEADGCQKPFCTTCGDFCGECNGDCFPDDHADVNPDPELKGVVLDFDLAKGTWSGTTTEHCSAGDNAEVCWDISADPVSLVLRLGTPVADLSACDLDVPVTVFGNNVNEPVKLEISGLPPGVDSKLDPDILTLAGTDPGFSVLRLHATGATPLDASATVTVHGVSHPTELSTVAPLRIQGLCGNPDGAAGMMNLVWSRVDDNGFPLNPRWAYEARNHERPEPFKLCGPDDGCTNGMGCCIEAHNNQCITQSTSRADYWGGGCNGLGPGHLNWQVVTLHTNSLRWDGWSNGFDNDYNFRLETEPSRPETPDFPDHQLTIVNVNGRSSADGGETRDVPLEFNFTETVRDFQTAWWRTFRKEVCLAVGLDDDIACVYTTLPQKWCSGDFTKGACAMVPGVEGISIGLLGIDFEHDGMAEHHPVYALAINTASECSAETWHDKWAFFLRNAGNEGWCSDGHIPLDLPNGTLRLTLPWRDGATIAKVVGQDSRKNKESAGVAFYQVQNHGYIVEATLPETESIVHGEIELNWEGAKCPQIGLAGARRVTPNVTSGTVTAGGYCSTKPESGGSCEPPPDCGALISGSAAGEVDDERLLRGIINCLPDHRQRLANEFIGAFPAPPPAQNASLPPVTVQELRIPPLPPATPPSAGPRVIDRDWVAWQTRQAHAACTLGPEWLTSSGWCNIPVSATCANGVVDVGEECDDGNNQLGDGCSPTCLVENDFDADKVVDSVDTCVNVDDAQAFRRPARLVISGMGNRNENATATLRFSSVVEMPQGWSFDSFDPTRDQPLFYSAPARTKGARFRVAIGTSALFDAVLDGILGDNAAGGWSKVGSDWHYTGAREKGLKVVLKRLGERLVGVDVTWPKATPESAVTASSLPPKVTMTVGREGAAALRGECGEVAFSVSDCKWNQTRSELVCAR